jgi:zinc transport system substrate-binding protein
MRIIPCILLILALILSCTDNTINEQKPVITVSIIPQKYFIQQIAGNKYEINVMVPPGASPATYDPAPAVLKQLNKSSAYFRIGYIGFENNWMNKLESVNKTMQIFDLSSGINCITNEQHQSGPEQHIYNIDPHTWLSPKSAKIIGYNIYDALKMLDPADSLFYRENYLNFMQDIDTLDSLIIKSFSSLSHRKFFIYHPALTYFARDYKLVQIPIEYEGKSPSPVHLKQLINLAKEENIKAILIQEQFDAENAKILAKEIHGQIIKINPLDENWKSQILYITYQLQTALENDANE